MDELKTPEMYVLNKTNKNTTTETNLNANKLNDWLRKKGEK